MSPPTNLDKAKAERELLKSKADFVEQKIQLHATTPLTEPAVSNLLRLISAQELELEDVNKRILHSAPGEANLHSVEYLEILDKLMQHRCSLETIASAFPRTTTSTTTTHSTSKQDIKLPRLELPVFNGDLAEWLPFRDMFVATVHNSTSLTKTEKLIHLKRTLQGEAARVIDTLQLTEANYDIAWDALTSRYQNERELLFSTMKRVFNQKEVMPNSASSLRNLVDVTKSNIRYFTQLGGTVDNIFVFLLFSKFDQHTRELWLQSNTAKTIPTPEDVFKFLESRATAVAAGLVTGNNQRQQRQQDNRPRGHHQAHHVQASDTCSLKCTTAHRLFKCPVFLEFSVQQRVDHLKKTNVCFNCLTPGHNMSECKSTHTCRSCNKKHNTLIHQQRRDPSSLSSNTIQSIQSLNSAQSHHGQVVQNTEKKLPRGILATAIVRVTGIHGNLLIRILLDGGSTNSYITCSLVKKLGLSVESVDVHVSGLGNSDAGNTTGLANFIMKPRFNSSHSYEVGAFVIRKISGLIPSSHLPVQEFSHLQDLELADPKYFIPSEVDVLIGSDLFWNILGMEKKMGLPNQPLGIRSTLGWLVAGKFQQNRQVIPSNYMTNIQLNEQLHRFFEVDDQEENQLTPEEEKCEEHFIKTVVRDSTTGRFTVHIPWKSPRPALGDSRPAAVRRLMQMERRLSTTTTDPKKNQDNQYYKEEYIAFMKEYLELGHMSLIPPEEVHSPQNPVNYIPHHFVLKADSTTTKFRVVFDGSVKTSTGISMNEAQMVGPTVQSTLFAILVRFRIHEVAFSADIEKMFRQMYLAIRDRDMHRIVWRKLPNEPIQYYRLNTVTYGTGAAPYVATRTLQHLIDTERDKYPLGASIADDSFYVDDLMGGSSDTTTAIEATKQLIEMCKTAGFPLRKWTSNDPALLNSIPVDLRETKEFVQIKSEDSIKTLGIHWHPLGDYYSFKIALPKSTSNHTMRSLYSEMSTLFDPLGWLAPTTIKSKLQMQRVWKLKINWDTTLPEATQEEWRQHKKQLKVLEGLKIPRFVLCPSYVDIQLIGCADASQAAMACCVYVAVTNQSGSTTLSLIAAKTKLSPLVPPTLPRLELNAAVLLVELLVKVRNAIKLKFSKVKAFSDSKIVLAWIHSDPLRWKTYVKNRVSKIQRLSTAVTWAHIKGKDNPADCASRGLTPEELVNHSMWWSGHSSMLAGETTAKFQEELEEAKEEENRKVECHHASSNDTFRFIHYFSSWKSLLKFTALCMRVQSKIIGRRSGNSKYEIGPYTSDEIEAARKEIIRIVQQSCFNTEICALKAGSQLPTSHKFLSLNPFVDENGFLRVGGRLHHAPISYEQKHPILLPRHHNVTKLIIMDIHEKTFHGGPQITLATLTQQYWITRGRDAVRFFLKRCVLCTRMKAVTMQQIMGNLPKDRVTPSRAFHTTGIDYAGPFTLKLGQRSKITTKAYIVVYVCFATKALHLEVASTLSTEGFLATFRRFVSRRGRPLNIYTDCGTNFVGARKVLNDFHQVFEEEMARKKISDELSQQRIHWHLNPPGAPHFGGLWEAGVKSVKKHLYSVIGKELLMYEELNTLIIQIEGILNSRPITAISTNPDDLQALTPAHFLIGGPITALPEPDLSDLNIGGLDRYQLIQRKHQTFWRRWSSEHISRMQQRPKWMKEQPQLQLGSIVIIKEENYPPAKWRLGRVIELHPGNDGLTRVATLKTMNGETRRAITKLCVLPVE